MNTVFSNFKNPSNRIELWLKFLFSIVYLWLTYLLIQHHEPWRDELQAFSLVRLSHSINELIGYIRYEGHPIGWYIIMYVLKNYFNDFNAVQIVHWAIASVGMIYFLWKAPFPFWSKVMMTFGYFFMYEYSSISRNYGIALWCYFLMCTLYHRKQFIISAIVFFIAMQFSLYSMMIALSFGIIYFIHHFKNRNWQYWLAVFIFISGIILFKFIVTPPPDIGTAVDWRLNPDRYTAAFAVLSDAFFPVSKISMHFWNSSIFEMFLNKNFSQVAKFIVALYVMSWILVALKNHPEALYFFVVSAVLMFVFIGAKYHGSIRHHGHLFIVFLMALWIKNGNSEIKKYGFTIHPKIKKWLLIFPSKRVGRFFLIILIVQLCSGCFAFYNEIKFPFSASKQAANFISENYPNKEILGVTDEATTSVAILMHKKIRFINTNDYREYLLFNNQREWTSCDSSIARASRFFLSNPDGILLVSVSKMNAGFMKKNKFHKLKEFPEAIQQDESFVIYGK